MSVEQTARDVLAVYDKVRGMDDRVTMDGRHFVTPEANEALEDFRVALERLRSELTDGGVTK